MDNFPSLNSSLDLLNLWIIPDLSRIILEYCKDLPYKRTYIHKEIIADQDIPDDTTHLEIVGCKKFYASASLENIISLEIQNSIILNIPYLPHAKWVDCNHCRVEVILGLPKCEILHCKNNKIITIDNIPSIEFLDLGFNESLEKLPPIPNCTWLNVSKTRIRKLPELPYGRVVICRNTQIDIYPTSAKIIA